MKSDLTDKGHSVRVEHVSSVSKLNTVLNQGPKIDAMIYVGHGSADTLFLGETSAPGSNLDSMAALNELSFKNFSKNATIQLLSCNSANGNMSPAHFLSIRTGLRVLGYDGPLRFTPHANGSYWAKPFPPNNGNLYLGPDKGVNSRIFEDND